MISLKRSSAAGPRSTFMRKMAPSQEASKNTSELRKGAFCAQAEQIATDYGNYGQCGACVTGASPYGDTALRAVSLGK
jgi:hypothetical protein